MNENIMVTLKLSDLIELENRARCYKVVSDDYDRAIRKNVELNAEITELKRKLGIN